MRNEVPAKPRHYIPDKPCRRGHRLRYISNRVCVVCLDEKYRAKKAAKV